MEIQQELNDLSSFSYFSFNDAIAIITIGEADCVVGQLFVEFLIKNKLLEAEHGNQDN